MKETKVKNWPPYLDYPIQPKPDPRDTEIEQLKMKIVYLEALLAKEKSKNVLLTSPNKINTKDI